MHIHLDALGGVAGDMFVAALLDTFPDHEAGVLASVRAALASVRCEFVRHNDGILQGRRFRVSDEGTHGHEDHGHAASPPHRHARGAPHGHGHRHWSQIRDDLGRAGLDPGVRAHALAIFSHLAEAEARVHGIAVEAVAFHEVGAWDSIADIVAAAHLIAALGAESWSVSPLPLGGGRVRTQHGPLPVPAPATSLLIEGFETVDDGVPGERVTPTGAAILRHLCDPAAPRTTRPRRLVRSGFGFGTKELPGLSNCLRVLAFEPVETGHAQREIGVVEFEVDDQSAEDLAHGLDRLRAALDVLDVVQMPAFGKKGRMMTHVRVLAQAAALDAVVALCFRETTTIGVRHRVVAGAALPREQVTVSVEGRPMRVKTVTRPDGRTAKAEADDAAGEDGQAARTALRREAERLALAGDCGC